jgi:hypothetical protein
MLAEETQRNPKSIKKYHMLCGLPERAYDLIKEDNTRPSKEQRLGLKNCSAMESIGSTPTAKAKERLEHIQRLFEAPRPISEKEAKVDLFTPSFSNFEPGLKKHQHSLYQNL